MQKLMYDQPAIKEVLQTLCQLFGLHNADKDFQDFLEDGYMTPLQGDMIRNQVKSILNRLRPNAIALVGNY